MKTRRMAALFLSAILCLLLNLVIADRAPDVQSPDVPEMKLWCGDKKLGTPTRTTGECMCKYDCDGPGCTRSQGFKFFSWKDGLKGARCLPPVIKTEAEKETARGNQRLEKERIARERTLATMNDPASEGESHSQPLGNLESLAQRWRELLEDLEFILPNLVVAVIISALFGTVLVAMVVMNLSGVREDMKGPKKKDGTSPTSPLDNAAPPSKASKKDD